MSKEGLDTEGAESVYDRHKCLFLLDEFAALGVMEDIQNTLPIARSFGLQYCFMVQHTGQLTDLYGEAGAHGFFANTSLHMFFGCEDQKTVDHLSARLGNITVDDIGVEPPVSMPPPVSDWDALTANTQPGQPFTLPMHGKHAVAAGVVNIFTMAMHEAALASQGAARAQIEQSVRSHQAAQETLRAAYQHKMSEHGKPRIAPDMIGKIIGKGPEDIVARAALVFSGGGETALIQLEPWWVTHQRALAMAAQAVEEERAEEERIAREAAAEHRRWQKAQEAAAEEIERRGDPVDIRKEMARPWTNEEMSAAAPKGWGWIIGGCALALGICGWLLDADIGEGGWVVTHFGWAGLISGGVVSSVWLLWTMLDRGSHAVQLKIQRRLREVEEYDEGDRTRAAWFRAKAKWTPHQRAMSETEEAA